MNQNDKKQFTPLYYLIKNQSLHYQINFQNIKFSLFKTLTLYILYFTYTNKTPYRNP